MDYTRRIYRFAYGKTGNTRDAEDLSQEILFEVFKGNISNANNPEAWLSGVCRHVWAKYLNRNKKHWQAVGAAPLLDFVAADADFVLDAEKQAEYESLRREISYLSKTRREVLIQYYFEGKSVNEIAENLNVAAATVRWHMSKARNELKERLSMESRSGMREKARLNIAAAGDVSDSGLKGLKDDLLARNIAWICYGHKYSVEDISRELNVPAVYIENILDRLVDIGYMKEVAGKYTTNFFIWSKEFQLAHLRYYIDNVPALVERFYDCVSKVLPGIRDIGFMGCQLPETELIWHILPFVALKAYNMARARYISDYNLKYSTPLRSDGTAHWIIARECVEVADDDDLSVFMHGVSGQLAVRNEPSMGVSYEYVLLGDMEGFDGKRIASIKNAINNSISEDVREDVAALLRDGLIVAGNDGYVPQIPYMNKSQYEKFAEIINKLLEEDLVKEVYNAFKGYSDSICVYLSDYIDENERNMRLMGFENFAPVIYYIAKLCQKPEGLSALVWEN